jgi:spore germination protein YaaH
VDKVKQRMYTCVRSRKYAVLVKVMKYEEQYSNTVHFAYAYIFA